LSGSSRWSQPDLRAFWQDQHIQPDTRQ